MGLEDGQQQFLYSRAVTTYFDLQGGLRSDIDSRPTRNWAALGIQGLAPYFFDLEITGFVSAARARATCASSSAFAPGSEEGGRWAPLSPPCSLPQ